MVDPAHIGDVLVRAEGIDLSFGRLQVLDRVDLKVHTGEVVTVIGPNGSGKSTLLQVLLGLRRADRGRIELGKDVTVGYMPQRLNIDRTLPLTVRRFLNLVAGHSESDLVEALAEVDCDDLLDNSFHELSGGEVQRVLLARALLNRPDLLVLDEPVQGIDVTGQAEMYRLIRKLRDDYGCGVLLVSHDLNFVMEATDEVVCLNHHVCCRGRPEAVSQHPEYRQLFGLSAAGGLALYRHEHDHDHAPSGEILEAPGGGRDERSGAPEDRQ